MPYHNLLCSIISLWKYRNRQKSSVLHDNNKSTLANKAALAVFIISNDDFFDIVKHILFFTKIGKRLWPNLISFYEGFHF
jgi:hypothetical protein